MSPFRVAPSPYPRISLGGGGRVGAELSLSEGLRLCLWFWLWLWLLEARFSNTRSLLPMGQPRTLPTGSSCISHTSPLPQSEGASRVVYAVAGKGSERAGSRPLRREGLQVYE